MTSLTDKLIVLDGDALDAVLDRLVTRAFASVVEAQQKELRALQRRLYVLKGVLTATEAGHVLGDVTADTVMGYVRELDLPCHRPGKAPLFFLSDLQEWVRRFPERPGRLPQGEAGAAEGGGE